jgi:peptidylprolyl isomerase
MSRSLLIPVALVALVAALMLGCQQKEGDTAQQQPAAAQLQITDEVVGQGTEVKSGDFLLVHYTGWLYIDGQKGRRFDSSVDRGEPWLFQLGRGKVIEGWDEGLLGMRVGGKRILIVPPEKSYGDRVVPRIPPNSTLYFEVELIDVPRVQIDDPVVGEGPVAEEGDVLLVHYTGWLSEDGKRGKVFDSSFDRSQPFRFALGKGRVIQGWEVGVPGMRVGGKRLLTIPAELAYGKTGSVQGEQVVVPPDTDLIFEIQLMEVRGK